MTQFLQATVYGLLQGGLLALVAVGFSLVWGVMNVVNLAHGAFVLGGAYIALQLNDAFGLDPFVSMVPAAAVLFATGMDRGGARLMGIKARHVYALTFGIAAAMAGAAGAAEGAVTTFSPAGAGYFTLFSFVVAVLGGLGNMWGALYGGLLLGLVMS